MEHLTTLSLAAALAWASGIRLYALVFLLGATSAAQWIALPTELNVLAHPYVLAASGTLLLVEFLADKVPAVDSLWDAVHTFIRIPAGALLAAGAVGWEDGPALAVAAGLLGGTITAGTHLTKAGSRAMINTSPEPFSNWAVSSGEDVVVLAGIWLAFAHPLAFLILLGLFGLLVIWLLPRLWRAVKALLQRVTVKRLPSSNAGA